MTTRLAMVTTTLDKMARGGMYDQLGGGFHRYSVDAHWLVPHFEKMLYDNALLSVAYLEAFQATGDPFYRQIVEETLDYVLREMTCPGRCDSIPRKMPTAKARKASSSSGRVPSSMPSWAATTREFAASVWGVTEEGNFEGHNILCRSKSDEQDAQLLANAAGCLPRTPATSATKAAWLCARRRVWPGRDEKILTSWNGLMIAAFAARARCWIAQTSPTPRSRPPSSCRSTCEHRTAGCIAPHPPMAMPNSTATWKTTPTMPRR